MTTPIRLDAHQHFWRYTAREYPWIPANSALARDWLPKDLAEIQGPLGFHGSIAVQARQTLGESHWLLGLADADPRVLGVVGWVDLQSDHVADDLSLLAAHPKFVGVRHVAQSEPNDRFLVGTAFQRGIAQLNEFGLKYDLLVFPRQLPAAVELVQNHPDQPFVLDHIAKPPIASGSRSPWEEQIRELATCPNVLCKVSGMITEADPRHWKPEDLVPYMDIVFEAFGEDRLMFGSDWPVCLLAGTYPQVVDIVEQYMSSLNPATRAKVFGTNAARFYGVKS
jgi:L-fuconolactonase